MQANRHKDILAAATVAVLFGAGDAAAAPRTGAGRSPWNTVPGPVCSAPELTLRWSGQQVGAAARQAGAAMATLVGCWVDGTSFAWTATGARAIGAGMTVDLLLEADAVTVTGCATAPGAAPVCRTASLTAAPANATVAIDAITLLVPAGLGNIVDVRGRASAPGVGVRVFAKSDVYYAMAPLAAVAADGTWQTQIWLAGDIATVDAVLFGVDVPLASLGGCTESWCRGVASPITGLRAPVALDGAATLAAARQVQHLAEPGDALGYLRAQLQSVGAGRALARSSLDHDRIYVYDQGVAATALALSGDTARAAQVLDALVDRQAADGSWPFVLDRFGAEVDPQVRYAGATAWIVLAMNAHDVMAGAPRYRAAATRALGYLLGQMFAADSGRGVRFNPYDLSGTEWDETKLLAVEHALETYAALVGHQQLTGSKLSASAMSELKRFIAARWRTDHFQPGYYGPLGANDAELYLDTQFYGMFAFGGGSTYAAGIAYNCARFTTSAGILDDGATQIGGFSDFRAASWPQAEPQVWTEGSAGMLAALATVGPVAGCPDPDGVALRDAMAALVGDARRRPFPTATVNPTGPYSQQASVAAAAWVAIADSGRNPLRPWE